MCFRKYRPKILSNEINEYCHDSPSILSRDIASMSEDYNYILWCKLGGKVVFLVLVEKNFHIKLLLKRTNSKTAKEL